MLLEKAMKALEKADALDDLLEQLDRPLDVVFEFQLSDDVAREYIAKAREALARRFFAAAVNGELKALEELLAHDVVLHGDGGGKAPALAHPVHGRAKVARTLLAWFRAAARIGGVTLRSAEVNGQPGALLLDPEGRLVTVLAVDVADGQVQAIRSIVNPDKLRHLGPTANLGELPAGD